MVAFTKYLPSSFRSDKDQSADTPHDSKSDVGEIDKELVVDPAAADDPSLNPGGLTLEEGKFG
jgi:hypothetical protein